MRAGLALLLGGMLLAAGLPKVVAPRYVASALRRVVDVGSDHALLLAGRLLGCWELALGAALVGTALVGAGSVVSAGSVVGAGAAAFVALTALTALTFVGFAAFVALAIRRGAACGCWASLSEGPAGGGELGRAVFLAALAVVLLVAGAAGPVPAAGWPSLGWAAGLLAATHLAATLGAALLPVPTARLRRQLGMQAAPGAAGRLGAHAALLAGFVHAGTRAGRRRYLAASTPVADPMVVVADPVAATTVRRSRTVVPPRPPAHVVPEGSTR